MHLVEIHCRAHEGRRQKTEIDGPEQWIAKHLGTAPLANFRQLRSGLAGRHRHAIDGEQEVKRRHGEKQNSGGREQPGLPPAEGQRQRHGEWRQNRLTDLVAKAGDCHGAAALARIPAAHRRHGDMGGHALAEKAQAENDHQQKGRRAGDGGQRTGSGKTGEHRHAKTAWRPDIGDPAGKHHGGGAGQGSGHIDAAEIAVAQTEGGTDIAGKDGYEKRLPETGGQRQQQAGQQPAGIRP